MLSRRPNAPDEGISPEVAALLAKLNNRWRDSADRQHGALTLPDLAQSDVEHDHSIRTLSRVLEGARREPWTRVVLGGLLGPLAVGLIVNCFIALFTLASYRAPFGHTQMTSSEVRVHMLFTATVVQMICLLSISPFTVASGVTIAIRRGYDLRAACARSLWTFRSVAAVNALASHARDASPEVRKCVHDSLRTLLPLVGTEIPADLSRHTSARLARDLAYLPDDLTEMALHVLAEYGAPSARGRVASFARWTFNRGLKELARRACERMAERAADMERRNTLLRPAGNPSDSADLLLHVTANPPSADPARLLRYPAEDG